MFLTLQIKWLKSSSVFLWYREDFTKIYENVFSGRPCLFKDVNFEGHNVGEVVKVDSVHKCSLHCDNEPSCFAWSYASERLRSAEVRRDCEMKDSNFMDGKQHYTGMTSGIKCGNENVLSSFLDANFICSSIIMT